MKNSLIIKAPDDWHLHLRDGAITGVIIQDTCKQFRRALIMPNLDPPLTNVKDVVSYQKRINKVQPHSSFTPFMSLYLTSALLPDEVYNMSKNKDLLAIKWYPKGVTTNSASGIAQGTSINPDVLRAMIDCNIVLCVHGESSLPSVDPFDREKVFIKDELLPLQKKFPDLRVVLEHITTRQAVEYVRQTANTAATITAHHLAFDRKALFDGGLRPHWYCVPLLKRKEDRLALVEAATSGEHKFFLGTDSAPHTSDNKESSCGCAGCYTAPHAIELYASIFESHGCLDRLEHFSSIAGSNFYRQSTNNEELYLMEEKWRVPDAAILPDGKKIIPLCAGMVFHWKARMVLSEV
ncbi:dihydroorotase [Candidatus Ichthyocystis hellenicum]|uniref:dihydroorotase n=1 Tax=Candidatus Ichthyocystis hellenicum TaxID=1561003 RepID=UPI000B869ADA|nr:dihydroorotase [Candidatus Ichthyocystis hellenicum]